MQTNGTFLSPKTVAWLKALDIQVGVSLDGPPEIHDKRRIFHSGKPSSSHVDRGIAAAHAAGVKPGYLAVVHDPKDYVKVLDYIVTERHTHSMRINYSSYEGRARDVLEFSIDRAAEFAAEWLRMVDYAEAFYDRRGIWLDIADLNLFVFHLVSKARPHMCYRSPCGIGNSILGFSHEGQIYLCDEVVGNPLFQVGHIRDAKSLKDQLDQSGRKRRMMELRKVENQTKCSTCTWKRFHGGGCTSKTFAFFGDIRKEDPMCRFYHVIFEELMWRLWKRPDLANLAGQYAKPQQIVDHIQSLRM
jgi:uncharacterized protein